MHFTMQGFFKKIMLLFITIYAGEHETCYEVCKLTWHITWYNLTLSKVC